MLRICSHWLLAAIAFVCPVSANSAVAVQLGNPSGTTNTMDWVAGFAFTVTLLDSNSQPAPGKLVGLVGSPANATIQAVNATTNASGQAVFTVKSSIAGAVVFTATNVTVLQTVGVEFTAPLSSNLINVNFYASNGTVFLNPQSDLVGVASVPSEFWNQFNGTSASPLLDASGG